MKKTFNRELKSSFSHSFEIEKEGVYTIAVRASCQPGWQNQWWLMFKEALEDILDLHLDDEDLRVEIDGIAFRKPKGNKGLFNSPAAFSGTKTLGKTKTVIFIIYLHKGNHTIKFIPDGTPYLEMIEIEAVINTQQLNFYFNTTAENENYYAWYTFALVNLPLQSTTITASAGTLEGVSDDDDLKILINGEIQENSRNHHKKSYFCGFTLKGREDTFSKTLSLKKDTHYLELFADKTPVLKAVRLTLEQEKEIPIIDPSKTGDVFNPQYVMKDSSFIESDSMGEEKIEEFLKQYGENYSSHLYHKLFEGKKVSFWIKKFTTEFEINPKIILTKLQAEMRLVIGELSINPSENQLDWALGMGRTESGELPQFKGFLTQLKEGSRRFGELFEEINSLPFTFQVIDGEPLAVLNRATYSLYRYTPHIAGANLFYRVYNQFFGNDDLGGKV